ncbi:MAG: hypothetical protein M3498_00955 [Deinococcota bacterium]|nr:hypothetical protein [Deinococcota bacterium]
MAELTLPLTELLSLVKGLRPLPEEVAELSFAGDSVFVTLEAEPLELTARVRLKFEAFAGGVVTFGLELGASSRREEQPYALLARAFGVPEPGVFNLHVPRLALDLGLLLAHTVRGVTVTDFRLEDGELRASVRIADFRLLGAQA